MVQAGLSCRRKGGAHLGTTTGNRFLPRPARNERGEGWGEGHPVEWASSPQPSPPVGEERELSSSGCLVVVTRCARLTLFRPGRASPRPPSRPPALYNRHEMERERCQFLVCHT